MPIRINREASEDFEEDKFIIKKDESLNGVIDVNQDVSTITVDLVTTGIQFDEQIINVENEDNVNFELKEEGAVNIGADNEVRIFKDDEESPSDTEDVMIKESED